MRIKSQDYNDVMVLEMQGDLDADFAPMLHNVIADAVSKKRTGIVLDMNQVAFIDSAGLEEMLRSRDYCSENRCQLRLAGLAENCTKILEITRLDSEFDRYGELAEAVKSFT